MHALCLWMKNMHEKGWSTFQAFTVIIIFNKESHQQRMVMTKPGFIEYGKTLRHMTVYCNFFKITTEYQ